MKYTPDENKYLQQKYKELKQRVKELLSQGVSHEETLNNIKPSEEKNT